MARIIKSVSLDPHTAQVAANIGNFSAFVRDALMQYEEHYAEVERHTHPEEGRRLGLCNGMSRPYCRTCWPYGPPPGAAWRAFGADPENIGVAWVQAQAVKANENAWRLVPNMQTPGPSLKAPKREQGLLGRLLGRG